MVVLHVFLVAIAGAFAGVMLRLMLTGPKATVMSCLVVAALGGIFCGVIGTSLGIHPASAAVGLVVSFFLIDWYAGCYERAFRQRVANAGRLSEYLLRRFDDLDGDGDGTIVRIDLHRAIDDPVTGDFDRMMLAMADRDLSYIGHVADARHVSLPAPYGSGGAVVCIHAISREDLLSYPERVRELFLHEFGEQAQ